LYDQLLRKKSSNINKHSQKKRSNEQNKERTVEIVKLSLLRKQKFNKDGLFLWCEYPCSINLLKQKNRNKKEGKLMLFRDRQGKT